MTVSEVLQTNIKKNRKGEYVAMDKCKRLAQASVKKKIRTVKH